jgi:aryl-alcohol dehydrogenase-like predicted oxidoreductase
VRSERKCALLGHIHPTNVRVAAPRPGLRPARRALRRGRRSGRASDRRRRLGRRHGGVFNSGLLAGGTSFDYAPAGEDLLARARAPAAACARHGVPLATAALRFPFGHPAVASVLVGARSAAEVSGNAAGLGRPIPAALWTELGIPTALLPPA